MLMRDGKKVKLVNKLDVYYIEDNKLWQEGPALAGTLSALNTSEIIESRWIQV